MTEWLKQQPDPSTEPETDNASALNFVETIKVNHVVIGEVFNSLQTRFSTSQLSDSIGIASRDFEPTLSIMYPGTDKPPLILSKDDRYTSALFVTISGQEYLAATFKDSIHLWNLANNTSKVVYKFEKTGHWRLCVIDENTVACVE